MYISESIHALPRIMGNSVERNVHEVVRTSGGERERAILARPHVVRYDQPRDIVYVITADDDTPELIPIDNKTHTILL